MINVTLEEYTNPYKIGRYAGICYGKTDTKEERLRHIVKVGHLSCLRFGFAVFHISGISRACLAQLTRSVHLSYLVRSSRYCDESNARFVEPESLEKLPPAVQVEWKVHEDKSRELYKLMLENGMPKQDARYALPQSQETELYMAGNYQAMMDFIKLRTSKSAQREVREVALEVQRQLQKVAPIIFGGEETEADQYQGA